MFDDPVFEPGDIVKCLHPGGYYMLTKGELYEVAKYEPKAPEPTFTWPAYVHVIVGDRTAVAHASRFELVQRINKAGKHEQAA